MKALSLYDKARLALAEAKAVDEVAAIRDRAAATQAYARQAKDRTMEADAAEIRLRAERKLGEMIREQPKAKGGQPHQKNSTGVNKTPVEITLKEAGIDKNLAKAARKAADIPEEDFENVVAEVREAVSGAAARVINAYDKEERRTTRRTTLAAKIKALPNASYGVIVADPEWEYVVRSEKGKSRAAENHYPTSATDVIASRPVGKIAAPDCILFLWATVPMLPDALEVMAAWGFKYKSNYVSVKPKTGTGYWNLNQHEHLLVGTCGNPLSPANGAEWGSSVIRAASGIHSAKPEIVLQHIERIWPDIPKIELNRRGAARKGWAAWGNEVAES